MNDRYATGDQGAFEPGSDGAVLRNKLGITDPVDMDEVELLLLQKLYEAVLAEVVAEQSLSVTDLQAWHRRWLGNVYAWAGEERSVNMGKGDFQFAAAAQIPRLLQVFERDCLQRFTPCDALDDPALVHALAETHVEFILIHPFREGNGRLSRLLADVMAVQAGRSRSITALGMRINRCISARFKQAWVVIMCPCGGWWKRLEVPAETRISEPTGYAETCCFCCAGRARFGQHFARSRWPWSLLRRERSLFCRQPCWYPGEPVVILRLLTSCRPLYWSSMRNSSDQSVFWRCGVASVSARSAYETA